MYNLCFHPSLYQANILPALVCFLVQLFVCVLYSVSLVQSKGNSCENPGRNTLERHVHLRVTHAVTDEAEQQARTAHLPPLATCPEAVTQKVKFMQEFFPKPGFRPLIQDILLRQRRKTFFRAIIERYAVLMPSPMSLFCGIQCIM